MPKFHNGIYSHIKPSSIRMRCPNCQERAMMEHGGNDCVLSNNLAAGVRCCPGCKELVFVVVLGDTLILSYPSEQIEFDDTNVPAKVVECFRESLSCASQNCNVAAAIMIRRAIEIVCEDQKAIGNNLKDRIKDLRSRITVPQALLDAVDHLRLLGNDAAHIESKTYLKVGPDEIKVAVDVVKTLIHAVYQMDTLVTRLKALQKPTNP